MIFHTHVPISNSSAPYVTNRFTALGHEDKNLQKSNKNLTNESVQAHHVCQIVEEAPPNVGAGVNKSNDVSVDLCVQMWVCHKCFALHTKPQKTRKNQI